jgi:hypothetical protein
VCFNLRFESEDELAAIAAGFAGEAVAVHGAAGPESMIPTPDR